ncbi:MAG: hypothetical protein U0325_35995 [Polyangiales bacterium]
MSPPAPNNHLISSELVRRAREAGGYTREDLPDALLRWIGREFELWFHARLDGTRFAEDVRVPLANVFIDLPLDEYADTDALAMLLNKARARKRAPSLRDGHGTGPTQSADGRACTVLIGGPGQGKTTLGHFLLQLHRAALLEGAESATTAQRRAMLDAFSQATRDLNSSPPDPRWPLWVSLPRCASWLGGQDDAEHPRTLLGFLCARIRRIADERVFEDDLQRWLSVAPWLLVLDGLDEVGASTARDRVLDAVKTFVHGLPPETGHVVVTSRPTGYHGEFGAARTLTLRALQAEEAIRYAERLVGTWRKHDPDRHDQILRRVRTAASDRVSADLFRTPLQVTILVALFGRMARAPVERWRLFRDYYDTIYQRELDREETAEVLRRWRAAIDGIHMQAALHLQVRSERDDGDERLTPEGLRAIITGWLAEVQGFKGDKLAEATGIIEVAARERLVLLTESEHDRWGFELRSFQEFMAAEALMASREKVGERLRAVSASTHWRNTLLFAISRMFSQAGELSEDLVLGLCDELDATSLEGLRPGASLALDVLEDGSANSFPVYVEGLLQRAFGGLHVPGGQRWDRLREVVGALLGDAAAPEDLSPTVIRLLTEHLNAHGTEREGAWFVLLGLIEQGTGQGLSALAARCWPTNAEHAGQLVRTLLGGYGMPVSEWLAEHFEDWSAAVSPWEVKFSEGARHLLEPLASLRALGVMHREQHARGQKDGETRLPMIFVPLLASPRPGYLPDDGLIPLPPAWMVLRAVGDFIRAPSAATLARSLRTLAEQGTSIPPGTREMFAWPLRACIFAASYGDELGALAVKAERGELGDIDDWRAFEVRLARDGVTTSDLTRWVDGGWPYTRDIATRGLPPGVGWATSGDDDLRGWDAHWSLYERASGPARTAIASMLRTRLVGCNCSHAQDLTALLRCAREITPSIGWIPLAPFLLGPDDGVSIETRLAVLDELGALGCHLVWQRLPEGIDVARIVRPLTTALLHDPSRLGLLAVLAALAARGIVGPALPHDLLVQSDAFSPDQRFQVLVLRIAHRQEISSLDLETLRQLITDDHADGFRTEVLWQLAESTRLPALAGLLGALACNARLHPRGSRIPPQFPHPPKRSSRRRNVARTPPTLPIAGEAPRASELDDTRGGRS